MFADDARVDIARVDAEMLADLVIAAVNEANRKASEDAEQQMSRIAGGMNVPGLF